MSKVNFLTAASELRTLVRHIDHEIAYVGVDDEWRYVAASTAAESSTVICPNNNKMGGVQGGAPYKPGRWIQRTLGGGGGGAGSDTTALHRGGDQFGLTTKFGTLDDEQLIISAGGDDAIIISPDPVDSESPIDFNSHGQSNVGPLELKETNDDTVSAANRVKVRYNNTTKALEVSVNGSAFKSLPLVKPAVKVRRALTDQTGTDVDIDFDTVEYRSIGSMYVPGTSTKKLIAPVDGLYSVEGSMFLLSGGSTLRGRIIVNGTYEVAWDEKVPPGFMLNPRAKLQLNAGDYVTLRMASSGVAVTALHLDAPDTWSVWFALTYEGPKV